jgi:hypothetical protein
LYPKISLYKPSFFLYKAAQTNKHKKVPIGLDRA